MDKKLAGALREYVDARILLRALTPGIPSWQTRLIKAWWALRGGTAERELALRWRKPRYRLMVADRDGGEWAEWVRLMDGKRIPICTRREGERRRTDFLQTHHGCAARLERARRNAHDS